MVCLVRSVTPFSGGKRGTETGGHERSRHRFLGETFRGNRKPSLTASAACQSALPPLSWGRRMEEARRDRTASSLTAGRRRLLVDRRLSARRRSSSEQERQARRARGGQQMVDQGDDPRVVLGIATRQKDEQRDRGERDHDGDDASGGPLPRFLAAAW